MASALMAKVQASAGNARIAAGRLHSLYLGSNGSLWAWGSNGFGQLGDGTTTGRTTPKQILTGVAAVAAGDNHTLALKTDGSLWAWGSNGSGQLGDGTTTNRSTPTQVLTGVAAVAAGISTPWPSRPTAASGPGAVTFTSK
jgi:alpha-tubulin suppressor-like RCC1 family protein